VQTAELIKEIGVPPCPAVLQDFMAEVNKDDPDFRRLSHLINRDVALAAAVLKTINSPFYGLAKKARTVHDALTLLGLRQTSRLIAGLLLRKAFATSKSPAMFEYWDSSAKVALMSGYLARELEVANLEEAHTFALFRDCGVPVLLTRFPEYEHVLMETRNENEQRRCAMEHAQFGFDHAQVGATLAQSWHMPDETWQAIRVHTLYAQPGFLQDPHTSRFATLIAIALVAEGVQRMHRGTFVEAQWAGEDAFITTVLGPVEDRLQLLEKDVKRILSQE
jgi:HD-like signal output (HDOD) protein